MSRLDIQILALTPKQVINLFIAIKENKKDKCLEDNNLSYLTSIKDLNKQIQLRFEELKSFSLKNEGEISKDLGILDKLFIAKEKKSPKESIQAVLKNLKNHI